MLKYSDIPTIKEYLYHMNRRIAELEKMAPTEENLTEVRKITANAKALKEDIRRLKGNMYPYAS